MNLQKQAFTLVELIVVITILAILGTIAFISLQGFSRDARDGSRITDLKSIEKGMEILLTKDSELPIPEDYVEITASGTTISYQGYAGEKVMGNVRVFGGGKDPLDETYYTYLTDTGLRNYQLLGFLENGDQISLNTNLIEKSKAIDYSNRYPILKGKPLGIIVDSTTKQPIQITGTGIGLVTEVNEYEIYFNSNSKITGTGMILQYLELSSLNGGIKNNCKSLISNSEELFGRDGTYIINPEGNNPFLTYCDMTVDGGGWTLVLKADGNSSIFNYNSSYWTNDSTLNESDYDKNTIQFKSKLFSIMKFDSVLLELTTGGISNNIVINKKANSLKEVFNGGFQSINLGKTNWTNLIS